MVGGAVELLAGRCEERPEVAGEEDQDEEAREDGAQELFLLDPDDRDRAVEHGLADLLLVLIQVGVGTHVAIVVLEDERRRGYLHAEVAQDAAVFDPDPVQAQGGAPITTSRGGARVAGGRACRDILEAAGAACKRFPPDA